MSSRPKIKAGKDAHPPLEGRDRRPAGPRTREPRVPTSNPLTLATPGAWLAAAEGWYGDHKLALGQVATDAHDEALYLILRTLGLPLDASPSVLDRALTPAEQVKLRDVFRRRVEDRVPAAYLTREAWLGEHRFYVDERVIIPRSYFLELIPDALAERLPRRGRDATRMIDVCTGSGCLAILLAHAFPKVQVDACDLSADALAVAEINVREHRLRERVSLYRSDVLGDVPPTKYDIILSNPPYEPSSLVDGQAPEFSAEPRMAHDGGSDGLIVVRQLLQQSRDRLLPHGFVVIEVGGLRSAIDREFRALKPQWLPTQDGSDCVVLFEAKNLR